MPETIAAKPAEFRRLATEAIFISAIKEFPRRALSSTVLAENKEWVEATETSSFPTERPPTAGSATRSHRIVRLSLHGIPQGCT